MTFGDNLRLGILGNVLYFASALLLASHVDAGQVAKSCSRWVLAEDFRVSPHQENPIGVAAEIGGCGTSWRATQMLFRVTRHEHIHSYRNS